MSDDEFFKLFLPATPWGRLKLMAKYRKFDFVCFAAAPFLLIAVALKMAGYF